MEIKIYKLQKELIEKPYKNPKCLIKSIEEFNQLTDWIITSSNNVNSIKFTILYDSLIHSDSAVEFHKRCDNQGATLSIIESEHGLRFGGYSTLTWESPEDKYGKYKENDSSAFIYSLTHMRKFRCTDQSDVIRCYKDYNVVYGYNDILIYNNFTANNSSYSNFGNSYDSTDIDEPKKYLAGSNSFKVRKVEVYKVEFH